MTFAAQVVRGHADHDERGRDEERDRGVHEAVREGRIEDDLIPVVGHEAAVDDRMADRSLHPTVRGQDPERGQERAHGDHHRCEEMHPWRHELASEEQHAQEAGFEEERHQHLVRHQGTDDVRGEIRVAAPVGPELERHHDPGNHSHPERHCEQAQPELRQAQEDGPAGEHVRAFEHGDVSRESDGERRQQDVHCDHPRELHSRQEEGIHSVHPAVESRDGTSNATARTA